MNPCIVIAFILIMTSTTAQKINQEVKAENQHPFLVGQITSAGLRSNSYAEWYTKNHDLYQVDTMLIESVKAKLFQYKILLFMGTWCGDSKREVPRFIKILEAVDFPMEQLKIVAVDHRKERYKKSPTGEEWGLRIKRVPTFIFYKDGREVNRIIESPIRSLEADIEAIVTHKKYTPNYPLSLHFD